MLELMDYIGGKAGQTIFLSLMIAVFFFILCSLSSWLEDKAPIGFMSWLSRNVSNLLRFVFLSAMAVMVTSILVCLAAAIFIFFNVYYI